EYWTWEMRDHVENFVTAGGAVGFLCGNTCWWQIRIHPDGETLSCYKVAGFDPAIVTTPERTTVNWWDPAIPAPGRPETDLTGVSYYGNDVGFPDDPLRFTYTVKNAAHWALQGTGLSDGDRFGIFGDYPDQHTVIAGECDRIQTGQAPN